MRSTKDSEEQTPHDGYLLGLAFIPEEGSSTFLKNIVELPNCTAFYFHLHLRKNIDSSAI
jgi:hypothetical protein